MTRLLSLWQTMVDAYIKTLEPSSRQNGAESVRECR